MKKRFLLLLAIGFFFLSMAGPVNAALTIIGTAQFDGEGENYNLIWDDDNNGNSVIWLDYINPDAAWSVQMTWAAGLKSSLTYNIDPAAYTVTWGEDGWRLPRTVDSSEYTEGDDGSTLAGYNITSSEMGHLYYEELENLGMYDTSGVEPSGWGLENTGDFNNLVKNYYWSATEHAGDMDTAWNFDMNDGGQFPYDKGSLEYEDFGLALRNGYVSEVPVPGAIWLFGPGLAGMAAFARRRKGSRG